MKNRLVRLQWRVRWYGQEFLDRLAWRPTWWPLRPSECITTKPGLERDWQTAVNRNRDFYGYGVVQATVGVCREMDKGTSPKDSQQPAFELGITVFQAGCMASWVSHFHPRGEEFRREWNQDLQFSDEGDRANETGGVLNPALLQIEAKD